MIKKHRRNCWRRIQSFFASPYKVIPRESLLGEKQNKTKNNYFSFLVRLRYLERRSPASFVTLKKNKVVSFRLVPKTLVP